MMRHMQEVAKAGQRDWRQQANASVSRGRSAEHPMLFLQRTIGNQAVQRLLQSGRLQAKLTISQPGDPYEQEADRVAEQVMRMPEPIVQRTCAPCAAGGPPCPKCEDAQEPTVQRKVESPLAPAEQGVSDDFLRDLGLGQPLDPVTRAFFEPRFGTDFSAVRIHTDSQAAESARSVNALAYTVGRDVVFNTGQYAPHNDSGRLLLAHELTHVLQQGGGRVGRHALQRAPVGAQVTGPNSPQLIVARQPQHQQPPIPLEQVEAKRIPPKDRLAIELAVTGYISLAFTAFSNATAAHAAAIKNEAKAKAEMIAAVVDVATGFLAPVFANYVVTKMIVKATAAPVEAVTKNVAVTLITRQDLFKAAFTGATKIANQLMKSNANALWGETEIDSFALALRNTFQRGAGAVLDRLTKITDEELLAVWTAYDPDNANESAYRDVLADLFKRYQKQVEPIGTGTGSLPSLELAPSASSGVYEVQLATRKRLANITVWSSGENNLWAWITPDMNAIARAKARALGLGIPTIALKDVNVPLAEILDPPRPDLRSKDMLEIARALGPAERQRAAADPDVVSIVEMGKEINGRVPNQYERHKTLFVLRGFSRHAIACLNELDSWFPSGSAVERHLQAADAAERSRLAKDPWFVGKLRAELRGYQLEQVLFTLGLGPAPKPPPEPVYNPYMFRGSKI